MSIIEQPFSSPLRIRGFRRLIGGQVLSDLANWLDFIALSTLIIYTWGYDSAAIAALSVCMGLPWVIIGPLSSVRIARLPGRHVLVVCDLLRAGIVFGMIWAPSLNVLLTLVFLKMSISAVFDPVRQGAIKGLVEPGLLAKSISLSQLSVNSSKVLAPITGGTLIGWFGAESAFIVGASFYAFSALLLCGLPQWGMPEETHPRQKKDLREAWNHISCRPLLKSGILYTAASFFLIFLYDGLFIILTKAAGLTEGQFGLLLGSVGIGSVIGALCAGQWRGWEKDPLSRMTLAGMTSGLLLSFVGLKAWGTLPGTLWFWVVLCVLIGICSAQTAVAFGYILQTETTDDTVGPVSALANALQTVSMLIAPILGAMAVPLITLGGVFLSAGTLMCGLALLYRLIYMGYK
ncbi:MAG TPA: MFS transporter [Desulfitobacterium dehalogenans]|uniref:MFS transporter n=1 Tax=Desulfitobacterium dehalogenans TaxID=36854 RepID=A0A7C6Z3L1_9FIRM|nr:MFS transporter [Desulfitobacterium dehalogenans]